MNPLHLCSTRRHAVMRFPNQARVGTQSKKSSKTREMTPPYGVRRSSRSWSRAPGHPPSATYRSSDGLRRLRSPLMSLDSDFPFYATQPGASEDGRPRAACPDPRVPTSCHEFGHTEERPDRRRALAGVRRGTQNDTERHRTTRKHILIADERRLPKLNVEGSSPFARST